MGCSGLDGAPAAPTASSPSPIGAEPYLTDSLVDQLFEVSGPYRILEEGRESVALTCSVFEASECWFGETYLQGVLAEELAGNVVEELGRDFVANGEFNQVKLRCSRPLDGDAATCQVDLGRGFGWEPLPVAP
jgi:hypothetical protein